ncbi:MAG: hypothetical protein EOM21_20345 [Gammaproteobacteria bacterium]|nr:hypothetical protein [Gammaproteobacteria bacterium]
MQRLTPVLAFLLAVTLPASPQANDSSRLNQYWLDAYGVSPAENLTQSLVQPGPLDRPSLLWERLAKAEPDELYDGQPKVNESYVRLDPDLRLQARL